MEKPGKEGLRGEYERKGEQLGEEKRENWRCLWDEERDPRKESGADLENARRIKEGRRPPGQRWSERGETEEERR